MCHDDDDKDAKSKKDTHLSTSTITNDNEFPSNLSHGGYCSSESVSVG